MTVQQDPRKCETCGVLLYRRKRPNGVMESNSEFNKRRFCGSKCAAIGRSKLYATRRSQQTHKRCPACETIKPVIEFYHTQKRGVEAYCKLCAIQSSHQFYESHRVEILALTRERRNANIEEVRSKARQRFQRTRQQNPEQHRAINRRWADNHRDRIRVAKRAGEAVRRAIRRGSLVRPDVCSRCGNSGVPIEAAHKDYSKPLDIVWLCRPCHRQWDAQQPKTEQKARG